MVLVVPNRLRRIVAGRVGLCPNVQVSTTKTALVTGANSGIGLETARALSRQGYRTLMLVRNPDKGLAAKADIDGSVPEGHTELIIGDLASQASIRAAVADIESRTDSLDLLVNNAGIQTRDQTTTVDGIDIMLAVNHLGPFLLTNLLLPLLHAAPTARIVTVASEAHKFSSLHLDDIEATRGYGFLGLPRYGETKLMNIHFTRELARRLADTNVTTNCLHPGAVRTNIGNPPAFVRAVVGLFFLSPEQGARTSLAAATDPAYASTTGSYFVKAKPADNKLTKGATNDADAGELWALSETLVGLG